MSKRCGGNINDMTLMLEGVRSHGLMTGRRDRAEQDRGHAGTRRYALALASVPPSRHGRTAGAFFAYFDAGVGLGGPAVGVAARAADPTGALFAAAAAVLVTAPVALLRRARAT